LTPAQAHNEFLHVLATQGVVGGAAFLGLLAALVWAGWRAWRRANSTGRGLLGAVGASVTAFYVQNLVGFSVVPTASLFAVLAGVLSRLSEERFEEGDGWEYGAWPGAAVGCVVGWLILAANLLYPSWQVDGRTGLILILAGGTCAVTLLSVRSLVECRISAVLPPRFALSFGRVALVALLAVIAWTGIVRPWRANWACGVGESWLDASPTQAAAWHERAVALAPEHDLWWTRLANAAQRCAEQEANPERRRRWRARERQALEMACTAEPARAENRANLARCLEVLAREGMARREEVLPLFDSALRDDPNNTPVLADAARAAVALGYYAQARAYIERGLQIDPDLGLLHGEWGALCLAERRFAEAEAHLKRSLAGQWPWDEEKSNRVRALLALTYLQWGQHPDLPALALLIADDVLCRDGGEVSTRVLRALALERLGRWREAIEEYRRVLLARPDHPLARARLGRSEVRGQKSEVSAPAGD
jgi:tetratricopeptide (TPR) repeat protein